MKTKSYFLRRFILIFGITYCLSIASSQKVETPTVAKASHVLDLLRAGDGVSVYKLCSEKVKSMVTEAQLSGLWKGIEGQFGAFKGVRDTTVTSQDSLEIVMLVCDFEMGSLQGRFVFNTTGKLAGFFFSPAPSKGAYVPPDYVRPDRFGEEEVSFGVPEWKVAGTLSLPKSPGPFPAVILVQGSGPHDRDETIGPNRPFKDIAWGLASNEIAVLRYEKRTKAYGHKMTSPNVTVKEEVIDDALEAIKFLRSRNEIDSGRIFLLGHSLGAMLAPEIATLSGKLAGIILAAGPARHLEDLVLEQMEYITSLKDNPTEADKKMLEDLREKVAKLKTHTLPDSARIIGVSVAYFYDLERRDQVQFAGKLSIPILILQGERDYQVTIEDISLWKKAIGDRRGVKILTYPDLNHCFVAGSGKARPEEYMKPGYVAKQVVEDISNWVKSIPLGK